MFSRCKSVHKMATGKSDDQLIQYDNKLELGTSYKMKLGPKVGHWPWMRGDNAWCGHQWQHDHFHILPHCLSVSAHCLVLYSLYIVTCTRTVAQEMESFTPSTCPMFMWAFLLGLALPFYFTHFLPHSFHFLLHFEVRRLRLAAHSAQRGYGLVWRVPPLHRSWATRRHSSPTKSLLRTPTTMTLHSRVCFTKLTE